MASIQQILANAAAAAGIPFAPFLALAPWRGRLLCGYCAALAKLRER